MHRIAVAPSRKTLSSFWKAHRTLTILILLIACTTAASAEDSSPPKTSPFSIRVTHLLGFAGAPTNANGTLTIEADALQFQKSGKPVVQVRIGSIQNTFQGDQSKQVGGLPMTLGKAAVPFGGGRAVSLFAHKKYDTLTLEYLDVDGGVHGAIFQLNKGQAETLTHELAAKGARVSASNDKATKVSAAEVSSENK
jgi:hypothetical protein